MMETTAIHLAMWLAKMDPKILDGWQGNILVENHITAAWSGTYHIFGGVWNSGVKPNCNFTMVNTPGQAPV
jgi:hypothetical protein